jgi:uncharacterized membrane protein YjjB (DUF3815 family)
MTLTEIIQILAGFVGSMGFAILFNIRGKRFVAVSIGGLLSWLFFLILSRYVKSEAVNYFIVACSISIYSEIMAIVLKTPTTTFITTALVPLIPGSSLYYTMAHAFHGNVDTFLQKGLYTLQLSSALALGIIVTSTLKRLLNKIVKNKARLN